jgi:hypothetical protein
LAYVPRADVVGLVFEAASRNDRVKVLLAHQNEILDDCDQALAVDLHSHVKGQVPLIRQAVASYRSGHVAASQALSVVVCDTLIRANVASKHTTAKTTAAGADLKLAIMADILRMELALAPVVKLLTDWSPESGKPEPKELSRHVTIHHATDAHLREDNALIALMLATSLIRGLSEMHVVRRARILTALKVSARGHGGCTVLASSSTTLPTVIHRSDAAVAHGLDFQPLMRPKTLHPT